MLKGLVELFADLARKQPFINNQAGPIIEEELMKLYPHTCMPYCAQGRVVDLPFVH